MKCARAEELFSAALDGRLSTRVERDLRQHLVHCGACAASYEELEASLAALRSGAARTTPPGLRIAILDAVDRAARADVAESERIFEQARSGPRVLPHPGRWIPSHAAAAVIGLAAGWLVFQDSISRSPETAEVARLESPAVEQAAHHVPEVSPELVPVPVPVIVEVERIVEVPRVVEVERVVPRGPLLAIDTQPLASALAALATRLEELAAAARDSVARHSQESHSQDGKAQVVALESIEDPGQLGDSPMVSWQRVGDRMSLQMRGPLHEIVPILLSKLESEDAEVAGLVERRLDSIRAEVASDPLLGPRLRDPGEGADSEGEDWNAWWSANAQLIAGSSFESSL